MSDDSEKALERTQALFDFLQGRVPEGYKIPKNEIPRLTPDQAWTVVWYLGNLYWRVPDHIERCELCGELFDTERSGDVLDYGRAPYHFCDNCMETETWYRKARRNPDRNARPEPRG